MGLLVNQITVFLAIQLTFSYSWARVLGLPRPDAQGLFFKETLPEITQVFKHDSVVLHCQVGGMEPTIHWLKDGVRIEQGDNHDYRNDQTEYENPGSVFGKSFTASKLYLDCVNDDMEGVYTCIGETPTARISQDTTLVQKHPSDEFSETSIDEFSHRSCLEKRSMRNRAARIYLWTSLRLEVIGEAVQLYCRAEGVPTPQVSWLDKRGREIPLENEHFKILENGDLLIKQLKWGQMGSYECQASNRKGSDSQNIFIYPMKSTSP
ncbi:zwei Ig domain protein zig-4-like isoform X2 [Ostrea edulis]|uniref:zwei Ig domain protein zig-4-like isoform X2 n=1 Tax=Ostrea edulis TaxID=37623 RepID=UPI0024AFB782|nr:zwei Ig domain protein zig-4-like isoform X2 [Ostrea edulis]